MPLIPHTGYIMILPKSSTCALPPRRCRNSSKGTNPICAISLKAFIYAPFGNACSALDCKWKLLWVTRKIHATHNLNLNRLNGAGGHWLKSWRLMWPSLSDKAITNCLMSFPASTGCLAAAMMLWGSDERCRKFLRGGCCDKEANKMSC